MTAFCRFLFRAEFAGTLGRETNLPIQILAESPQQMMALVSTCDIGNASEDKSGQGKMACIEKSYQEACGTQVF